jgi:hypothetical protein
VVAVVTIAALYVHPRGPYVGLDGVEVWDEARDARTYAGPWPVVAHPPCHLWVNLAAVNYKRWGRLPAWYPGGTDGGCFAAALEAVRTYGGVLEHPAISHAWAHYGLATPLSAGRWRRAYGERFEWVCEVWQSAYGHPARKRTWLYYSSPRGRRPFDLNWERRPGTHQVGWFDRAKPTLGKRAASATPTAFRDALIQLARSARQPLEATA